MMNRYSVTRTLRNLADRINMPRTIRNITSVCLLVALCAIAHAGTTAFTPQSQTIGGHPVQATATFTTGAGTLTITLVNTLTNDEIVSFSQNLSGLSFTLSSGTTGSVSSSAATFIDIGAGGVVTSTSSVSGSLTDLIGWGLTGNGTGGFTLTGLPNALTGRSSQTIIGGTGSTAYSNANGSIASNSAFLFVQ
jgi:hypothetical protein